MSQHPANRIQWPALFIIFLATVGYATFIILLSRNETFFAQFDQRTLLEVGVASFIYLLFIGITLTTIFREQAQPSHSTDKGFPTLTDTPAELSMVHYLQNQIKNLKAELDLARQQAQSQTETKQALINVMEDLNEQKQKVEIEKAKDEAILANIGEGIIVTDSVGQIMTVNKAATALLGYSGEELIQRNFFKTIQVQDLKGNAIHQTASPLHVTLTTKQTTIVNDFVFLRKDGTKVAVSIAAAPVILNQEVLGTVTAFRDITKEKEVDRMKTEFISLASHQLRTPLAAIKWFGEMMESGDAGELSPEQKEFIQNINLSAERMLQLINSLLNISRIESGRIIVEPVPTYLKKLVEEIEVELQPKLHEKQQSLIISAHPDLPLINIDPRLIREVYLNLLTNAIKYSPNGKEITVLISKKEDQIISQISDCGYGIPKQEKDRVFQKFYRGENIIKVVTDGTGLGLYLVKAIIDSSGGSIWFESEEGEGTTFWFSLPLSGMKAKKGEVALNS